ncbi:MAG: hypothetical protein K2N48_04905 [Muribaculaceae bacterium]|nr:hypothetical protein [Muribaculaceae bacterium]
MIDPKTLHIGSHVSISSKRRRIDFIDKSNGQVGFDEDRTDDKGWKQPFCFRIEDVEPIPITAELLTELGFTNTSSTRRIVYTKGCEYDGLWVEVRTLKDRWEVFVSDNDWDGKMAVRYLHELEQFLYLTTKTELIKE